MVHLTRKQRADNLLDRLSRLQAEAITNAAEKVSTDTRAAFYESGYEAGRRDGLIEANRLARSWLTRGQGGRT